ncbi:MAG: NADH-quinone oxidoreductase subunit L [Akkermansiaceae bacterium]|jgi:NADH-quinone oxidoreductase subunit L
MEILIYTLMTAPVVALLIGFCFSNHRENPIYGSAILGVAVNMLAAIALLVRWLQGGMASVLVKGPVLYHAKESEFALTFFLDGYGLAYILLSTFLTGIIVVFSRTYLHREKGFKRFFNILKFFYCGLMVVLLAGNLEVLFVGWEIIGVTSFFLISFYRERYLPVKNAVKVVSLYRVADISMLLGIWVCHHYFGRSVNFAEMDGLNNARPHIMAHRFYEYFIPATFLLAAMVKSAQVPFSSWLPRAMEGPTTSSAIFYGSLSVHIGVFLLIRTSPLWENNLLFCGLIGLVGLSTCIVATLIGRVQSTIKTQIAYSSVAQIGLMFIEVALGLYWVAIAHFICNALLRSHQLLVSPSVLNYQIHNQFFHFSKPAAQKTEGLVNKLKLSMYTLGIKEFNLDRFMFRFLWRPLKKTGGFFGKLGTQNTYILALPPFLMGAWAAYHKEVIPESLLHYLPEAFALVGLVFILQAFVERRSALNAWALIVVNQLYQALAFSFNEEFDMSQVYLYLSGILVSAVIGICVINRLRNNGEDVSLAKFHGHSFEYPRLAFLFVFACLGLAGFPVTPTFIGEDLMLGHIHENQFPLLILIVLNLIMDGLVIFRIYSRLFLGPHEKGYHETAYRSS